MPKKAEDDLTEIELDVDSIFGDTMPIEEFRTLGDKEIAKNQKVNWEAVLEDVLALRKPFNTTFLKTLAQKHSYRGDERISLYHSELVRVIDKWDRDKSLHVLTKIRESDNRRFYYVQRVG